MLSFLDPLVVLLHSALRHLSTVMPGPPGLQVVLSLVLLTLLLRTAMLPLAVKGFRGQRAREALAPELARLQKQHARDRVALVKEVEAAHQRAGIGPLAGLGASFAQAPALMASYRLVMSPMVAGHANVLTTASLLGMPLSVHWLPVLAAGGIGPVLLCAGLFLGLLCVAWLQARRQAEGPALLRVLPFGSVAWAAVAPVAFSIYLLTSTSWTLAERALLPRLAGG
jgi:YidC/Oxa1 family membrane protein insertase